MLTARPLAVLGLSVSLAAALVSSPTCDGDAACDGDDDSATSLLSLRRATSGGRLRLEDQGEWQRRSVQPGSLMPKAKCFLNESACTLESLTGPTLIYTGTDNTKCILGDDYAFLVTPGAPDKLVFYFEGGGACWEANGSLGKVVVQQCTNTMSYAIATSGMGFGIQNFSEPSNPFIGYTFVEALYCSGDAFLGNTTMVSNGTLLVQNGYEMANAAVQWAKKNMRSVLTDLVVTGYSAGSIGAMGWSYTLLQTFKFLSASVLLDSYVGLFPNGTQQATVIRWGSCGTPLVTDAWRGACLAGDLTIQDVLQYAMQTFPRVAFGSIQSKTDSTQIWFYQGMAQSWGMTVEAQITPQLFYAGTNAIMARWSDSSPNYIAYLVDGSQHCFIPNSLYYTANTLGPSPANDTATDDQPPLSDWVTGLIKCEHVGGTECEGEVVSVPEAGNSTTYCAQALVPKVIVTSILGAAQP